MEIEQIRNKNELTIKVIGEIDSVTAPKFEAEVFPLLNGIENLTLDFEKLEYISSAGLRSILVILKVMNKQGKMKIINVGESPRSVFEMTGFDSVLDIE